MNLTMNRWLLILLLPALLLSSGCSTGEALARAKAIAAATEEKLQIKEEELAKIQETLHKARAVADKTGSEEAQQIVAEAQKIYDDLVIQIPTFRQLAKDARETFEKAEKAHEDGGGIWSVLGLIASGFIPAASVAVRNWQNAKRESDKARAEQAAREAAEREREKMRAGLSSAARLAQRLKKIAPDAPDTKEAVRIAEAEQRSAGVQDLVDVARKSG